MKLTKVVVRNLIISAVAIVTFGTVIGACSEYNDDRGIGDAPVQQEPDREIRVFPNGDGFPNIAFLCIGGNGVYTTTREAPPVVVASDPECE
jgi:hypothetical protein